jgi:hypothetical protein
VTNHDDQPHTTPATCPASGRRRPGRARPNITPNRRQARDICPERPRLLDPDHEAFVEWFVSYWLRQGAKLFTGTTSEEA